MCDTELAALCCLASATAGSRCIRTWYTFVHTCCRHGCTLAVATDAPRYYVILAYAWLCAGHHGEVLPACPRRQRPAPEPYASCAVILFERSHPERGAWHLHISSLWHTLTAISRAFLPCQGYFDPHQSWRLCGRAGQFKSRLCAAHTCDASEKSRLLKLVAKVRPPDAVHRFEGAAAMPLRVIAFLWRLS